MTLMEMIQMLAERNNHTLEEHRLYWALEKGMPEEKVKQAAELWLSENPEDWSEAHNMVFQYTSYLGRHYHNTVRPMKQGTVIYLAPKMDRKTMPHLGEHHKRNRKTKEV